MAAAFLVAFQYQMIWRLKMQLTTELQRWVAMITWSPVSWIEVKMRAREPSANRNTVIAESCPVWPLRKFVMI